MLNPGEFPYRRGIHSQMYREKSWSTRQYSGYGSASEANLNFKRLIAAGNKGVSIAFDLPTQMGLSADTEMARFEVGKVGVSIETLEDMRELLLDIPLEEISLSMTINATSGILLLMYQIVAEERNLDTKFLRGTLQNDILKEFITRSTQIFPLEESIRFTADIFEYCSMELPQWSPVSISGYHFAEAGATPTQEVAFAISNGLYYLEVARDRGMDVEVLASRVSFFFSTRTNLLTEIAKLRAARAIWAKLVQERFSFNNPKSLQMRIHAQTAGSELVPVGIENNLSRVTIQALAAVLGGVQSLHTNAHDEALNLPTEFSSGLAINIQEIIRSETDVCHSPDPFGGSFLMEKLTSEIEEKVSELVQQIEASGGVITAVNNQFQRNAIEENAYRSALDIETGKKLVVGVNHGVLFEKSSKVEEDKPTHYSYQKGREQGVVQARKFELEEELKHCAASNKNVMHPIKNLLIQGYSSSTICDLLKECWGTA